MDLSTAIGLIEKGVTKNNKPQFWADLGAGKGLFTEALAAVSESGSTIYAVDIDQSSLNVIDISSKHISVEKLLVDFNSTDLNIEQLDGIVMANSLHFIEEKSNILNRLQKNLKPTGIIIIIEYDLLTGNSWVPYPIPYKELKRIAIAAGFTQVEHLGEVPSLYGRANIYSALLKL